MNDISAVLARSSEQSRFYAIQGAVDHFLAMSEFDAAYIITSTIAEMMRRGALHVFGEIYQIGKPVVLDWHIEEFTDYAENKTKFRLHYRMTVVSSHNVVIPVFEFVTTSGKTMWKCRYCSMVNIDEATYCGEKHEHAVGCGAPRKLK